MSACACELCASALFPRAVGQCHGYGRYAVACRCRANGRGHAVPLSRRPSESGSAKHATRCCEAGYAANSVGTVNRPYYGGSARSKVRDHGAGLGE